MRFLSPLALVGLAIIALPIAIHLLVRRRAVRLDFPSLKFLRETPSFRLRPRRIQQPLLLALRVAAIILLVFGLSAPLISFFSKASRTRVILLDASLSMRASGVTEAAKDQARLVVRNLEVGERAAIISFSTRPLVLAELTADKNELNDAINRYQPTFSAVDYALGFESAGAILNHESEGPSLVDLISDFQASGFPHDGGSLSLHNSMADMRVVTHPVGAELQRNAFLIDEEVINGDSGTEISVTDILVAGNERSAARRRWKLDASDASGSDIEWRAEQNGQITARVQSLSSDDFDSDDTRFMAFELSRKKGTLLIERESDSAAPYFRPAFEAAASEKGDRQVTLDRSNSLPASASELSSYSLVALSLSSRPLPGEMSILRDYVGEGGNVWFWIGNDVDTNEWNQFAGTEDGRELPLERIERLDDNVQTKGFGTIDSSAPAMRSLNERLEIELRAVSMHKGYVVTPRPNAAILMRWNDSSPVFISSASNRGSVLLLATSPARLSGNLGTSSAFPALVSSVAKFSMGSTGQFEREVGQAVTLGLPPTSPVRIVDAGGKSTTAIARELVINPALYFPTPGIYRVESNGLTRYLAINTPKVESEPALSSAPEIESAFKTPMTRPVTLNANAPSRGPGRLWRYFLAAALLLLIVEMFLAMRQHHRIQIAPDASNGSTT